MECKRAAVPELLGRGPRSALLLMSRSMTAKRAERDREVEAVLLNACNNFGCLLDGDYSKFPCNLFPAFHLFNTKRTLYDFIR